MRCGHYRESLGSYSAVAVFRAYVARVESTLMSGYPANYMEHWGDAFPLLQLSADSPSEWTPVEAMTVLHDYLPQLRRQLAELSLAWLQLHGPDGTVLWEHPSRGVQPFIGTAGLDVGVADEGVLIELADHALEEYPEFQASARHATLAPAEVIKFHVGKQTYELTLDRRYRFHVRGPLSGGHYPHLLASLRHVIQCLPIDRWNVELADLTPRQLSLDLVWKLVGSHFDRQLDAMSRICSRALETGESISIT